MYTSSCAVPRHECTYISHKITFLSLTRQELHLPAPQRHYTHTCIIMSPCILWCKSLVLDIFCMLASTQGHEWSKEFLVKIYHVKTLYPTFSGVLTCFSVSHSVMQRVPGSCVLHWVSFPDHLPSTASHPPAPPPSQTRCCWT